MIFTQKPQNYASLFEPLCCRFEGTGDPRTLTVEVRDLERDEVIHLKELHNTTSGEIDLGPLLRHHLSPIPQTTSLGFVEENLGRWITVQVRVEEAALTRTFMLSRGENLYTPVVGSFPEERRINYGESEELTLMGSISKVLLEITTPEGSSSEEVEVPHAGAMLRLFRFDTGRFPERVTSFRLTFYLDGLPVQRLNYRVHRPTERGGRVAWIDRCGALQHYTFPRIEAQRERQQRTTVEGSAGELRFLTTTYDREMLLVSHYEARDMREALVELGTSYSAWWVTPSGEYLPIEVRLEGEGVCDLNLVKPIRFVIRPTRKGLSLWSC